MCSSNGIDLRDEHRARECRASFSARRKAGGRASVVVRRRLIGASFLPAERTLGLNQIHHERGHDWGNNMRSALKEAPIEENKAAARWSCR